MICLSGCRYTCNARSESRKSLFFTIIMLLLNLLVVCVVVVKQHFYPSRDVECTEHGDVVFTHVDSTGIEVLNDFGDYLKLNLVVMPVVHGIFLTFNNAFKPKERRNALRWGAAASQSEIYQYRARASKYSARGSSGWPARHVPGSEGASSERSKPCKSAGKAFVNGLNQINEKLLSDGALQDAALTNFNQATKTAMRLKMLRELPGGHPDWIQYCKAGNDHWDPQPVSDINEDDLDDDLLMDQLKRGCICSSVRLVVGGLLATLLGAIGYICGLKKYTSNCERSCTSLSCCCSRCSRRGKHAPSSRAIHMYPPTCLATCLAT